MDFNPNNPGTADSNVFGLPYSVQEADLILLPIPWQATVSYGVGTADGPMAILQASKQIDLYHPEIPQIWTRKIAMVDASEHLIELGDHARSLAEGLIDQITTGDALNSQAQAEVNAACVKMIDWVYEQTTSYLAQGKTIAGVGGDHSTPLGIFKAYGERAPFGILQIDAHCDLRRAYEGFTYSHASIMYNALTEIPAITQLTQVGIRDYCEEEMTYIHTHVDRVSTFFDRDIQFGKIRGTGWHEQCQQIIATLPPLVFISFDIDGLTPDHCPHTGTPVPGGLQYAEAVYLLEEVANHRQIISFDLNEVSPGEGEWDANVGARILFALCSAYWISRERQQEYCV
jgi:agmatinase